MTASNPVLHILAAIGVLAVAAVVVGAVRLWKDWYA